MYRLLAFQPSMPFITSFKSRKSPPIACVSGGTDNEGAIKRRNVCLGGLYGAAATIGNMAFAAPIQPPDITDTQTCQAAVDPQLSEPITCCPSYGASPEIIDFRLPDGHEPLRVRKPAHRLTTWETDRLRAAVRTMKELEASHPWNFMQQAHIHCAFCNAGFRQVGYPDVPVEIHWGWLFLPWHRYYMYFWEKILGKLIDDPTFAIPYWEWDDPQGMEIPSIFKGITNESNNQENPLYDCNRNADHLSAVLDLRYVIGSENEDTRSPEDIICDNLYELHSMMADYLGIPECFVGFPILQGQVRSAQGRLEVVHNAVHRWVGLSERPFRDMGTFHTAARDPIFFAHHANVDRLWALYRKNRQHKIEFPTDDWLEAAFVFYDENNNVVKCKIRDCLDMRILGYQYEEIGMPAWSNSKKCKKNIMREQDKMIPVHEFGDQPRELTETIRALVTRPKPLVARLEEGNRVEVIRFTDFKCDPRHDARFDVYIAKPINGLVTSDDLGEYVGDFMHIPHSPVESEEVSTELCLAIATPLKDIEAEESEKLVVSLVPRCGSVTITPFGIVHVSGQPL